MKYVKPLTDIERYTLEELLKNHTEHRYRIRAHSILQSQRGFKINEISSIYLIDRDTISIWINNWEAYGLVGLFDEPKSGRPSKLTKEEQAKALEYVKDDPRSLKKVVARLEETHDKNVSVDTVKRLLKKVKTSENVCVNL